MSWNICGLSRGQILFSPYHGNLCLLSRKYKQFTSKYNSRVLINARKGFLRLLPVK